MHFPLCAGSMSVDSWIHWHPSSLLFTCYLGAPPLAESFCSGNVFLSILSRGSGADPLRRPQSPGPSLPCLEEGRWKRTERTVREMFESKTERFYKCCWLTSHRDYNMMSLDGLDSVKDNEWPGASMLRKLKRREMYYYLSHCFSHIDFSAIMNHSCLGNFTGLKFVK